MKTKWMLIPVVALTLGCTRELDTQIIAVEGDITLYATSGEPGTKTVLQQDGSIFWSPGDRISVFYGDKSGMFESTNTTEAAAAEFRGSLENFALDGTTEFVAAYPYSPDNGYSGNSLILSLPTYQMAEKKTFVRGVFLSVAKSKDYNLHFYNVCGGVKFTLNRGDITKVVFRGNNGETLSGRLAVEFSSDGSPIITDVTEGINSVTLIAPSKRTLDPKCPYYLVMIPQALTKGYTMELYTDTDVPVETITSESPVTIRRSVWGVLKDLGTEVIVEPEMVDLGLSVQWATFNLGATRPEQTGYYYAWGETEPKWEFSWANWKWCDGTADTINKYGNPPFDNRYNLDMEDDAAHVKLGDAWRIPTIAERDELFAHCTLTPATVNGEKVIQVTSKINGNSIYLPESGYYLDTGFINDGYATFWTSSIFFAGSAGSGVIHAYSSDRAETLIWVTDFFNGFPIRPVYGDLGVPVSQVKLDREELVLSIGETATLTAIISPENASLKDCSWESSNPRIVSVTTTGEVFGVSPGVARINVKTLDGNLNAYCRVTVNPQEYYEYSAAVPEKVDLGLPSGLKWASFNLGATAPEEYGDYFAWGETQPYYLSQDPPVWKETKEEGYYWPSYKWCHASGEALTKYCNKSNFGYNGYTDYRMILEPADDAARVNLGENWRMPTDEEWEELLNGCTSSWTTINGVNGYRFTSNINGNSIFLPAASIYNGIYLSSVGSLGNYWSSSLYDFYPDRAWCVSFFSSNVYRSPNYFRNFGLPIRPVYDDNKTEETGTVIWENDGTTGATQWDYTYYFALEGKDNGDALTTFPENIWNIIKNETFYMLLRGTNPYIRIVDGWWRNTWLNQEFMPGSERLTENGDGTWTLEINFTGDPILDNLDESGLLITGSNYTLLKMYY
ncbi:MAG: Ig-like domain-containing protein [Bacteroidales bacterium]|nr:Ig-like domain-containing protein [Bacteroidales bacterium]